MLSWFDNETGRYLTQSRNDWVTVAPVRALEFVSLDELISEIGVDATRFFNAYSTIAAEAGKPFAGLTDGVQIIAEEFIDFALGDAGAALGGEEVSGGRRHVVSFSLSGAGYPITPDRPLTNRRTRAGRRCGAPAG